MAKKTETVITLTDDLDGTKADRTIAFGYDGVSYEIELSKKNATALEKSLQPYIAAGRRVRAAGSRPSGGRSRSRTDLADIRTWAVEHGLTVSARGRIAQSVQDAYDDAH